MVWTTCSSFPVQPISTAILFCSAAKQRTVDNGWNLWYIIIIVFMIKLALTQFWNYPGNSYEPVTYAFHSIITLMYWYCAQPSIHFNWKGVSDITKEHAREIMFFNKDKKLTHNVFSIECFNNLSFMLVMTISAWDGGEILKCILQQRWVSSIE
mgnify:CR=1 FL=1